MIHGASWRTRTAAVTTSPCYSPSLCSPGPRLWPWALDMKCSSRSFCPCSGIRSMFTVSWCCSVSRRTGAVHWFTEGLHGVREMSAEISASADACKLISHTAPLLTWPCSVCSVFCGSESKFRRARHKHFCFSCDIIVWVFVRNVSLV